jgi:hypothetical protein
MSDLTICLTGVGVSGVALASAFVRIITQDDLEPGAATRVPTPNEV